MTPGKPLTRQRSAWVKTGANAIGEWFERQVHDGRLRACRAEEPAGWHLSISHTPTGRSQRYPTWDEIAHARYELLPHWLDVVMHLPAPGEYVAVHDTCFHLHEHPERSRP